jgi:hypothetical protein
MDAIWPLVVGFLLTTVLGSLLGSYLQYEFNVMMLARLRNGTVGRRAPDPLEPTVMGPAPSRSS